jgi:hypothetical protein
MNHGVRLISMLRGFLAQMIELLHRNTPETAQRVASFYFCCTLWMTGIAFGCFRLQLDLGSLKLPMFF